MIHKNYVSELMSLLNPPACDPSENQHNADCGPQSHSEKCYFPQRESSQILSH